MGSTNKLVIPFKKIKIGGLKNIKGTVFLHSRNQRTNGTQKVTINLDW